MDDSPDLSSNEQPVDTNSETNVRDHCDEAINDVNHPPQHGDENQDDNSANCQNSTAPESAKTQLAMDDDGGEIESGDLLSLFLNPESFASQNEEQELRSGGKATTMKESQSDPSDGKILHETVLNKQRKSGKLDRREKRYACLQCNKTFTAQGLTLHRETHHKRKETFQCERCDKTFAQKSRLNLHRETHGSQRSFECHLCDKAFALKSSLDQHLLHHSGRTVVLNGPNGPSYMFCPL